jgi:hypothetical protein
MLFLLRNDGTFPYVGKITIRLLDEDGKVVLEKTADYSDGIATESAGQFHDRQARRSAKLRAHIRKEKLKEVLAD